MTGLEGYGSPAAVESAIGDAAKSAYAADPSLTVQERIRLECFHRFLCRVFSEGADDWVLKGGTSMLARVASARSTTDMDLFRQAGSLDSALQELRRLAAVRLADFFRFEYASHSRAIEGNQQPYTEGYRVTFDAYIGAKKKDSINVDLAVNVVVTAEPEVAPPVSALRLAKLPNRPYRLYPVVDQIADKVCATLATYGGFPSSREKDLVDLVVLAVTQDISANGLSRALSAEADARNLKLPDVFVIPAKWGGRYAKLARQVPVCDQYRSVESASRLMRTFLDPVLAREVVDEVWDHVRLAWV